MFARFLCHEGSRSQHFRRASSTLSGYLAPVRPISGIWGNASSDHHRPMEIRSYSGTWTRDPTFTWIYRAGGPYFVGTSYIFSTFSIFHGRWSTFKLLLACLEFGLHFMSHPCCDMGERISTGFFSFDTEIIRMVKYCVSFLYPVCVLVGAMKGWLVLSGHVCIRTVLGLTQRGDCWLLCFMSTCGLCSDGFIVNC